MSSDLKRQAASAALGELMARQQTAADALATVLEREQAAIGADADALLALADEKQALVTQLDTLNQQCQARLQDLGYDCSRDGMAACIAWCDQDGSLRARWDALTERLDACRRQNQVNGMVVERNRHAVQQAIALLTGQTTVNEGYNAHGESVRSVPGRSLAEI